jgi:hypothetical protein
VTTQAEFFQQHAVDGVLPDALMTQMLALPAGDIAFTFGEGSSGSPTAATEIDDEDEHQDLNPDGTHKAAAPATDPATAPAPAAAAPAPSSAPAATPAPQAILAKDGVHTIPFERLEEAREIARQAKERADAEAARAAALAAEIERLKTAGQAPAPSPAQAPAAAPATEPGAEAGLFGDYSDQALAAGIEKLVSQRTADLRQQISALQGQLAPVQQAAEIDAARAHWTAIYKAHPDADSLVESAELQDWINKQPSFVRAGYEKVLDEGAAGEVVELFDAYKAATGKTAPPPAAPAGAPAPAASPAAAAAAQAAAAIAAAPHVTPTSLSEIPAGTSAHHDEAAAMLEMSPVALMTKLEGKTPEQINALMNKLL